MSPLTFLVAESFLLVVATPALVFIGKLAADRSAEIITGVVRGVPVSPRTREGILFGVWLPWQAFTAAAAAVLGFAQLQMASHVSDVNAKAVAYFVALLAISVSAFSLVLLPIGLLSQRAKVRRDQRRKAEAD
jgi:hypothetical protein